AVVGRGYLVMPMTDPDHGVNLEAAILDRIRHATGLPWGSLQHFNEFLKWAHGQGGIPLRLFIAIDDLGHWFRVDPSFKNNLMKLVARSTQYHSFYWVFTLHDTDLDSVLDEFFRTYAARSTSDFPERGSEPSAVGEWIVLDDLNLENEIGIRLIRRELGQ